MQQSNQAIWAVVPAAGTGKRFGSSTPKQYLELAGSTVMAHTLSRLAASSIFKKIVLAVSEHDQQWQHCVNAEHLQADVIVGGAERWQSVYKGLEALSSQAMPEDWVMVHDVARPCITQQDLTKLRDATQYAQTGIVLAQPVTDTHKCIEVVDQRIFVTETASRETLWRVQTPQMFRFGLLKLALENVSKNAALQSKITDEASAVELLGARTELLLGRADNIKITLPEDLALAEFYLMQQQKEGVC